MNSFELQRKMLIIQQDYTNKLRSFMILNNGWRQAMKMTVKRSAKNSARCQRSIAILSLRSEHDGISSNLKFHDWCDLETTLHAGKP